MIPRTKTPFLPIVMPVLNLRHAVLDTVSCFYALNLNQDPDFRQDDGGDQLILPLGITCSRQLNCGAVSRCALSHDYTTKCTAVL